MIPALSEGFKPEESLKKAQDRLGLSLSEPRKRGAAEVVGYTRGMLPKKPNPVPKRGEIRGRSGVMAGVRKPAISYVGTVEGIRQAILPKRFRSKYSVVRSGKQWKRGDVSRGNERNFGGHRGRKDWIKQVRRPATQERGKVE